MSAQNPWYREFWPWFVVGLLATAVTASLATVWIAVDARPERIDGYRDIAVPVQVYVDAGRLEFDLGLPPEGRDHPAELIVRLLPGHGPAQVLRAAGLGDGRYRADVGPLPPGHIAVELESAADGTVRGNWAYPAPVWKLERVDADQR